MSNEIPERDEVLRSTIITVVLSAIFLALAITFWAWSAPGITTPLTTLNDINPFIAPLLETLFMLVTFIFLTVTVVNLRLYLTKVRAGWTEIILMLIFIGVASHVMFEYAVAIATVVLCLGFVAYLYLLQE